MATSRSVSCDDHAVPTGRWRPADAIGMPAVFGSNRGGESATDRETEMFREFQEFALKGNVVDLAVGIIIGAAFTGIVTSLVNDVIMPPIGVLMGGIDFSNYFLVLSSAEAPASLNAAKDAGIPVLAYGRFINALINFAIVAWALFFVVRQMNVLRRRLAARTAADAAAVPAAPPAPPRQELLLEEIRDLLKARG